MTGTDDGFIGRWSRRKRAAEGSEATPLLAPQPEPSPAAPPAAAPELAPEHGHLPEPLPLTDEELAALPRVEDLVEGSDIKAFLREGVPRALRSAALRRMWMLTPAIRDYKNPAVDYAWDWNTPGGVPGDGCAPSPERAAEMLRDLFMPRTPAVPAEPEITAPETSAETLAIAETDGAENSQPDSANGDVGGSDPAMIAVQVPDELSEAESSSETVLAAPRHRHGSALPS